MKSRRKLKLFICGLLAGVSVFAFSGCSFADGVINLLFNETVHDARDMGEEVGKGTAEALLENEHTQKIILDIDEWLYGQLSKILK